MEHVDHVGRCHMKHVDHVGRCHMKHVDHVGRCHMEHVDHVGRCRFLDTEIDVSNPGSISMLCLLARHLIRIASVN